MKNFTPLVRCKNLIASKLIVLLFFVALLPSAKLVAQCTFNNTLYIIYTPIYDGTAHVADGCFWGGDLMTLQVVTGGTYIFSTCPTSAFDTQITVYNAAGTTVLGYSDDFCGYQSQVTVVAAYTGTMNVLVDQYNCATNSGPCQPLSVTASLPAAPVLPTCVNTPSLSCPGNVSVNTTAGTCSAAVTYTAPVGTSPCDGPATASFNPGAAIADNATTISVINQNTFVAGGTLGGQISLQSVCLQINHSWVGDLTAKLTSPSGTQITLFHRPGRPTVGTFGCSGNNLNVCIITGTGNTLDATATCGNLPAYAGNYTASSANLTSLNNGGLANGNWTLAVSDSAGGDVGSLVSWSLNFTTNTVTTQTSGLASGSSFPTGTTTNAFKATDGFGNISTCSFNVVVTDNESPVITCPPTPPLCATYASVNVPVNILDVTTVTSTLNISGSGFIADINVLGLIGTHTYVSDLTFTLTSPQGTVLTLASGSCSTDDDFSINFDDEAAGGITCPLNAGNTEIPANLLSAFDGENANGTWTLSITDGFGGDVGVLNGWSLQICTNGMANNTGQCGATYAYTTPTATDNCSAVVTQTSGLPSGSLFPVGTTTNTFVATDPSGNTATCSFDVVVADVEAPTITCPATLNVNTDLGLCTASNISLGTATTADNCAVATVTNNAPAVFPKGTTVVKWTVTDASGNTATCNQNVVVTDGEAPTLSCPGNVTVNNTPGTCGATVSFTTPTVSDNCAVPSILGALTTTFAAGNNHRGNMFDISALNAVTITSFDGHPQATTNFAIYYKVGTHVGFQNNAGAWTLVGTATGVVAQPAGTPTVIPIPVNITIPAGQTYAFYVTSTNTAVSLNYTNGTGLGNVYASDANIQFRQGSGLEYPFTNGGSAFTPRVWNGIIHYSIPGAGLSVTQTGGLATGSTFPVGTTTNSFSSTDAAGNTGTCSFDVIVVDNEVPVITVCPGAVSVSSDAGSCGATAVVLGTPTFTDNCPGATASNDAPASFPVGNTTVTWTVTDAGGNSSSPCTQVVTVTDDEDPTITCPGDVTVSADAGVCSASNVNIGTPSTSDNCGVAGTTNDAPASYNVGSTTVTWTVTDVNGNTATCTQTVTVTDDEDPTITCPGDVTVSADAGVCSASNVNLGTPTTGDNCGVAGTTNDAPASYNVGSTTVTWTVTDVNGNTATCTQTVTVTDDEDPTITCPGDVTVSADAGVCSASNVNLGTPTTGDNCGVAGTINDAPVSYNVGSTTVTWTVTDVNGNTATCTQTVTVTDDEDPTITCPGDVTVSADAGVCSASNVNLGASNTSDNCGVAGTTNDAPASYNVGSTTVTWTVTDVNGNTATCTQTVTVTDDEDPTITCPGDVTVSADAGVCSASNVNLGTPNTSDNCGVAGTANDAPASYNVGSTTVTWTVTDVNGNTATCTQTVTVTDDEDPIITCSAQSLSVDAGLCGAANTSLTAPATSDNCGVATVTNDAPSTLSVGTTTVNWTVTDVNGNTASCAQTVTVTDDEDPTITCPSSVSVNADAGSCDATNVSLGTPTTADNCGVATTTNDAPSSFPTGNTTVTWTVTDVNGNTATCTQVVTVVDNIIPTITCPATVSVNADAGSCTASNVGLGTPTTSDNCSVASVTNDAPATFPLGSTTVTWTVTDASGNTSSCGQTVTVLDAELPTITCPTDVNTTGCGATSVTLGTPTTADNCSVATVTNDAPALFPLGTTSVVWTVTDGSGNTATCTQTVTVTGGVDTSIAVSGNTYTANAAGSTYQWYDCGNNTNVSGATGQSFTPTTSGSYALIVTSGGCTDTSACFPVIVIGINNVIVNATLKVFPNPATETVNVQVTGTINGTSKVQLFDVEGRLVRDFVYDNMNGTYPISLFNLAADVYELRITTAQGIWNSKVMKVN